MKLRNRHVLIFGGTSGIGLGIAKRLIEAGADVVIAGRNKERLARASSSFTPFHIHSIQADISNVQAHNSYFEQAAEMIGHVDAFVNAAAIEVRRGTYEPWDVTELEWDRASAIDFKGAFFLMRNEIDYLKEHNTHGNILNIASNAAVMPIFGLYGAAKLAIIEWTKALGRQFGHNGIIINAIAPGATLTPMTAYYAVDNAPYPRHAIDRFITVEEQAELALFLLSDIGEITAAETIISDGGDKGHYLIRDEAGYAYKNA